MNEQDIQDLFAVLQNLQNGINMLAKRQDALETQVQPLEENVAEVRRIMFDDIINPAKNALEGAAKQDRYDDFMTANGDKFAKYGDTLKAIEGDDFDLADHAFEEYDSIEGEKPDADVFGDEVVALVEEQINKIREATGIPADADVDIHQDGETGEVTVEADGEEVTDTAEEEVPAEPAVEEATDEAPVETEEPKANPNDIDALMAELEKNYKD